jgi:ornithine decarboxylase
MSERIHDFLRRRRDEGLDDGPCLVVDLDIVRENYRAFAKALPDSRIFYAVKANPAPELLALLVSLGSCFDTASVAEIEMVLAAGATPERISFGNTIKKERDIARAHALGVRLFAVDCKAEVEKIARAAPGAKVFCRFLFGCAGAEWPLSRKFGCDPEMAADVLDHAQRLGLDPCGVSFHVGSQQRRTAAWDEAPTAASTCRWSISAAASPPGTCGRCRRSKPTGARSSAPCAGTSATASRKRSSNPGAAWSAMPA